MRSNLSQGPDVIPQDVGAGALLIPELCDRAELAARAAALPGPAWLIAARIQAAERFDRLPDHHDEDWKYTALRRWRKIGWLPAVTDCALSADQLPEALDKQGQRLVFVNGRLRSDLSQRHAQSGLTVEHLATTSADHATRLPDFSYDTALCALNTALCQDGVAVSLKAEEPHQGTIEVLWVTCPQVTCPQIAGAQDAAAPSWQTRNLLRLGAGSQLRVIERHISLDPPSGQASAEPPTYHKGWDIALEAGARLTHVIAHAQAGATAFECIRVTQAEQATYQGWALDLGGGTLRRDWTLALNGRGARGELAGIAMLAAKDHCDNRTVIEHQSEETSCRELFHALLDGQSLNVFQGKLHVHRAAQRTDGYQLSRALLLSDQARANAKPQLEIYADDVKCSHGSTSGTLEEEALFYLRSRGLSLHRARCVLAEAFAREILAELKDEDMRAALGLVLGTRVQEIIAAGAETKGAETKGAEAKGAA